MAGDRVLVGSTVGRYRVIEELGRGGMAVVYRAEDPALGRTVAIKVMHAHLEDTAEARERFRREARAVAAVRHPGVVEIFDYAPAEEGHPAYIVTGLCTGPSLQRYITEHGTPLPEVAALIVARVARALACAHERGIIHRDVKPENVLLDGGRLVLTDFGIARQTDTETLTQTGAMVGSPAYMSPEQAKGEELDLRSDVFSCGTLLYRLSTGALPFTGKDALSTALAVLKGDFRPASARNPRVAASLDRVIARCLRHDRSERYADAGALAAALEAVSAADGLVDLDAELGRYFADPGGYNETLGARVLAASLTRAHAAVAERQWARAAAECNRILALDPDHAEARALVARLGRGRRSRAVLALCGGAVLLGAVGVAAGTLMIARPPPPAAARDGGTPAAGGVTDAAGLARADAAVAGAGEATGGAAAVVVPRPDAVPAGRRPPGGTRSPPPEKTAAPRALPPAADAGAPAARPADPGMPAASAAPVRVSFFFTPWCELSVDGQAAGRIPPKRELWLRPGPHRVVCTQEPAGPLRYEKVLTVEPGRRIDLHRPLVEQATLKVALREGDEVQIEGRRYGRGAHSIRPGTHKVVVLKAGVAVGEGVVDITGARPCTLVDVPRLHCAP
jgi:serine/threonine-protein kinase